MSKIMIPDRKWKNDKRDSEKMFGTSVEEKIIYSWLGSFIHFNKD